MAKYFGARKFEDFEIKENHKVVGTLRIKPSGILWAPRSSHRWYRIGIDEFGKHAEEHGTRQKNDAMSARPRFDGLILVRLRVAGACRWSAS